MPQTRRLVDAAWPEDGLHARCSGHRIPHADRAARIFGLVAGVYAGGEGVKIQRKRSVLGPSRRSKRQPASGWSEETAANQTSSPHLSQTASIAATYRFVMGSQAGAKDQPMVVWCLVLSCFTYGAVEIGQTRPCVAAGTGIRSSWPHEGPVKPA